MFDINTIKRKVVGRYSPFAKILTSVEFVDTDTVDLAATDGKKIYYNSSYLNTKTEEEQIFVLAHEVCHIALRHMDRLAGRNVKLWNYVTDAIINQYLKMDGPILKGAVDLEGTLYYDAEALYEKIIKNKTKEELSQLPDGHASHELWKKEEKKSSSAGNNDEQGEDTTKEQMLFRELIQAKKEYLQELKNELQKKQTDLLSESENRRISVGSKSSLIQWKYFLKEAVNQDMDWSYRNATIEYGIVTPSLEEIKYPITEVLLDTSGSIKEDILRCFLKECKNILQFTKLKVGCFDTSFYGFYDIRTDSDIERIPLYGGGGTNFDIAFDAFSKRVENKVIFTDGEAMMPKKSMNVLWIVIDGNRIKPLGGRVINITGDQLLNHHKSFVKNNR